MESFSALLALCAGNSPVTWSFDVLFDLRLNERLSKQPWGDLRRHRGHYDVNVLMVGIPIPLRRRLLFIEAHLAALQGELRLWCWFFNHPPHLTPTLPDPIPPHHPPQLLFKLCFYQQIFSNAWLTSATWLQNWQLRSYYIILFSIDMVLPFGTSTCMEINNIIYRF